MRTKQINADRDFVKWLREQYPEIKDPERTRKIYDELTVKKGLGKRLDEMLYGKKKK